jgi:hypothetical protein
MGRPKGSKNKASEKNLPEVIEEKIDKNPLNNIEPREIKRYCPVCDGVLFGGQIIHKKGCRKL